jgi:Cu/Ag efflux protein CusF
MRFMIGSLCAFALLAPAAAQVKDGAVAVAVAETEAVVTVTKVDAKARTVTVLGPKGGTATIDVPPEAQNFDQVKPGARFKVRYVEALAVAIGPGGAPSSAEGREVRLAPKGAKPGGVSVRTKEVTGVVDAIDYTNRYVALRGPKGDALVLKIADDVPLEQLSAGDRVTVVHTQALAMEMIAQPAKKSAAKKAS